MDPNANMPGAPVDDPNAGGGMPAGDQPMTPPAQPTDQPAPEPMPEPETAPSPQPSAMPDTGGNNGDTGVGGAPVM